MKKIGIILFCLVFALPVSAIDLPDPNVVVHLVNEERVARGLEPLSVDSRLVEAAKEKGKSLISIGDLRHTKAPEGVAWWPLEDAGYFYSLAGENLALDIVDPKEMVSSWMASPSHRKNIMEKSFEDIGVAVLSGYSKGSLSAYVVMYTAKPKMGTVLGAVSEVEAPQGEDVEELMNIIIGLLKQILLIQRNINA